MNFKDYLEEAGVKEPTIKQMSVEDLQWALDAAIEKGNKRRQDAIIKELKKRGEYKTV